MNAAEAGTAAEDPFGAAPFRLPPGNHDSLNLCCAHSRPYALSIYFIVWLLIFVFVLFCPTLLSLPTMTTTGRKKLPVAALDGGN